MRFLPIHGKLIRKGFTVADPLPYVSCLECAKPLEELKERRYGLHDKCRNLWTIRSSKHPGNTAKSDRETFAAFKTWLQEPSPWETPERARARCVALGIVP